MIDGLKWLNPGWLRPGLDPASPRGPRPAPPHNSKGLAPPWQERGAENTGNHAKIGGGGGRREMEGERKKLFLAPPPTTAKCRNRTWPYVTHHPQSLAKPNRRGHRCVHRVMTPSLSCKTGCRRHIYFYFIR